MNQRPKIEGRAACLVAACMAATGIGLGCGYQPKAVQAPNYNPRTFADSLLDRFDADGDGVLSRQEAEQAPGLVAAWPRYDLDGDDAVSREELEARAANWAELGDGLTSIMCVVRMDGRQIGDVHVKLVPDESLEGVVKPAEGVSHSSRPSFLSIPAELKPEEHRHYGGMPYGLYWVEVSHPQWELVPAARSRGCDVGPSNQERPVVIHVERLQARL